MIIGNAQTLECRVTLTIVITSRHTTDNLVQSDNLLTLEKLFNDN